MKSPYQLGKFLINFIKYKSSQARYCARIECGEACSGQVGNSIFYWLSTKAKNSFKFQQFQYQGKPSVILFEAYVTYTGRKPKYVTVDGVHSSGVSKQAEWESVP